LLELPWSRWWISARCTCEASCRKGQIGKVKLGQPVHVYLDSNTKQPIDAWVARIDPQATFTPENTYFQDERVKQVFGVKLQLKGAIRFCETGHARGWRDSHARRSHGRKPVEENDNRGSGNSGSARSVRPMRRKQTAIRVSRLSKHYGAVEAVRGIELDVGDGEIFGLIGPDGAGKTSTFQILAGVMEASGGIAEIFGQPARAARSQTGYLTQAFSLYPDLTVLENIRYIGDLRRVAPGEIAERGQHYLQMFDMDRFSDRLAGKLSGGMKQKLALTCALVPQPRVLLLDEPTTGVDPVSRREFWDTLAHLAADGLTILVATPYMDEAERCHRVALMHEGTIQEMGTPAELRAGLHAKRLELRTKNLAEAERFFPSRAALRKRSWTSSASATGWTCWCITRMRRNAL
jgi:ABC-type multidrug transport system ATPase subunit